MLCDVGPKKLSLLQVIGSTAQPFKYGLTSNTSTSMPPDHLRHAPDQVLPWLGVEEEALAFRESLPATSAMYDGYVPTVVQLSSEEGTLLLLDWTLFPVVNQLGDLPGLASMKFNEHAKGFGLNGMCEHACNTRLCNLFSCSKCCCPPHYFWY